MNSTTCEECSSGVPCPLSTRGCLLSKKLQTPMAQEPERLSKSSNEQRQMETLAEVTERISSGLANFAVSLNFVTEPVVSALEGLRLRYERLRATRKAWVDRAMANMEKPIETRSWDWDQDSTWIRQNLETPCNDCGHPLQEHQLEHPHLCNNGMEDDQDGIIKCNCAGYKRPRPKLNDSAVARRKRAVRK